MRREAKNLTFVVVGLPGGKKSRKQRDIVICVAQLFHLLEEWYDKLWVGGGLIAWLASKYDNKVPRFSVVVVVVVVVVVLLIQKFVCVISSTWTSTSSRSLPVVDVCRCHQLSAAVEEGDDVGVRDRRKNPYFLLKLESNLWALSRVTHSYGLAELDTIATVRKEDESLLSGLVILFAFLNHLFESVDELLLTHIPVLFDVPFLHSEALEALNELLAIVAESFEIIHTFEVVESAKRRVVLILKDHSDHFRGSEGQTGWGESLKGFLVDIDVQVFGQKWQDIAYLS